MNERRFDEILLIKPPYPLNRVAICKTWYKGMRISIIVNQHSDNYEKLCEDAYNKILTRGETR